MKKATSATATSAVATPAAAATAGAGSDAPSAATVLSEMAALRPQRLTVSDGNDPARYAGALVSWNLFRLLGGARRHARAGYLVRH